MPTEIIKDDDLPKPCLHPQHDPPGMIVIPPGHKMVHTCPACGQQSVCRPPDIRCDATMDIERASLREYQVPR